MKMYAVKIPHRLAGHFAKWTFENGVKVLLSYGKEENFFDTFIICYVAVEDGEKETAFATEFGKYKINQ